MFLRRHQSECLILLILMVVTATVFWRVLENDVVSWDDPVEIYNNPHLKGLSAETLHRMFFETGYAVRYQPLTWLTWVVVYQLFVLQPTGSHMLSFLPHGLKTGQVFLLIRKLL